MFFKKKQSPEPDATANLLTVLRTPGDEVKTGVFDYTSNHADFLILLRAGEARRTERAYYLVKVSGKITSLDTKSDDSIRPNWCTYRGILLVGREPVPFYAHTSDKEVPNLDLHRHLLETGMHTPITMVAALTIFENSYRIPYNLHPYVIEIGGLRSPPFIRQGTDKPSTS